MNIKAFIKKVLTSACIYFSIITAIYSIVVMIVYVDDNAVLLDASRVLLFFVASLLFALANGVLSITKLHGALKLLIHYLLSLFAFCTCMMLPLSPEGSTMLIGIATFTVIYLIAAGLVALFRSRYKAKAEASREYTSQFSKK